MLFDKFQAISWFAFLFLQQIFIPLVADENQNFPRIRNAALIYWQGFAELPELTDEQYDCLYNPDKASHQQLEAIVKDSHWTLDYILKHGENKYCDWGLPWDSDGLETRIHHIGKVRKTFFLYLLRARLETDEEKVVKDLAMSLQLILHTGGDRSMMENLVAWNMLREFYKVKLEKDISEEISTRFLKEKMRTMNPLQDLKKSIEHDIKMVKNYKFKEEHFIAADSSLELDDFHGEIAKYLQVIENFYTELIQALALDRPEALKAVEQLEKNTMSMRMEHL